MNDNLKKALTDILEEYGIETLKDEEKLAKLLTDTDISKENEKTYFDFLETAPEFEDFDELVEKFNIWLIKSIGFPSELIDAEKIHGFEQIVNVDSIMKIFTDTNIPKEVQDKYVEFLNKENYGKDVEELRTRYVYYIDDLDLKLKENKKNDYEFLIKKEFVKKSNQPAKIRLYSDHLTRFEKARVVGARALQISYGAPILVDSGDLLDPIDIALLEYEAGLIPISVLRK